MVELVAYPSRWRLALLVLGSLALVTLGFDMIGAFGTPSEPLRPKILPQAVRGWLTIIAFGTCTIVFGRMLVGTEPLLRISESGIWWRRWSNQIIPWSEIVGVSDYRVNWQRGIALHLRDPGKFPRPLIWTDLSRVNRALGGGDVAIKPSVLDHSFDEIMAVIEHYRQQTLTN